MAATTSLRRAVYTGVFDPPHLGHQDVIGRASRLFDEVVVAVGINPDKSPLFEPEERVQLLERVAARFPNVSVLRFDGLAVKFVRQVGARVIIRGLRTTSDMEYEFNMSLANQAMDPDIETVFLMAKDTYSHLSSSLLRQIATFGGSLHNFVPDFVKEALEQRVREQQGRKP
jgi:pantetheine-phosphate adenylyltransferase